MRKISFIWASFSGIFGGEIVGLAPVVLQVVEFPDIVIRRPIVYAGRQPWEPRCPRPKGARQPVVMVDGAAAHNFEVLSEQLPLGLRVGKSIGETHTIYGVLLDAIHRVRRGDAEDLVYRRHNVVAVVKLRPRGRIGLDFGGPPDCHRVTGAAKM